MNYSWSDIELKLLHQYDELGNEIACLHPDEITTRMQSDLLYLEAQLLILNKYVIGYVDGKAIGVYSFKEALQLESYYLYKGKVFFFFPIVKEVSI